MVVQLLGLPRLEPNEDLRSLRPLRVDRHSKSHRQDEPGRPAVAARGVAPRPLTSLPNWSATQPKAVLGRLDAVGEIADANFGFAGKGRDFVFLHGKFGKKC